MKAIVCVDENWGIGKNNGMLFHLPDDLKFFKIKTINKKIVMGYNTLLSLPQSQPLPNRENIVLSTKRDLKIEGVKVVHSKEELFSYLGEDRENVFIIGGEKVYNLLLKYCDTAYVTKVKADGFAQKFFPNIDEDSNWEKTQESEEIQSGKYKISFTTYKRN